MRKRPDEVGPFAHISSNIIAPKKLLDNPNLLKNRLFFLKSSGNMRPGRSPRSRRLLSFDLNVNVPVGEYVFNLLVPNAPWQMIIKADTDLCIIKGLCWSETARNYANCLQS